MRSERPPVLLRCGCAALKAFILAVALMTGMVVIAGTAEALPDIRLGYTLDEGAGTAVADASSNGTAATATSPNWTAVGRFGNAIVFDGNSTRVRSNTDVALGATFTLEAWVFNPGNQDYEAILTIGSERDLYLANGTLNFYAGSANLAFGAVPTNVWQHVALVSDGNTVRAYLEGVQLGATQNTALPATTAPLQIGAWFDAGGTMGDYFSGTLDEIRVYNRALSAAEIATDRTAAVSSDGGGAGGDTTPPVVSGGAPSGTLAAGTTQTTLEVTTSETATCRYTTTPGTAYAAMTNTFATTGGTAHSTAFTGLTNGSSYTVYVRCQDAASNANTSDYTVGFSVAAAGGGGGSGLGSWTAATSLPEPRSGNGAVSANGYLYLIGGINGSGTVTSTVYMARTNADGTLGTWSTTTPVPVPIRSIRPVFANGFVYLTGGTSDGGTLFSTVYYAPVQANGTLGAWNTTTALPQAQISHTAFAVGGFLYVVGGNIGSTCVTTVRYAAINANGTIGSWITTSALPQARCGIVSAGATYNGYLYVAAGFNNSDLTNRVYYARINANGSLAAWQTNATNVANAREYLYAEAVGGTLYVMGGQGGLSGNVQSSVERATINADGSVGAFTAATSMPGPRSYLAGAQASGTIYVLGGGTATSGGTAQSNVWFARPGGGGGGGGDTTPPVLSNGAPTGTLAAGTTQATLQVTTNEAATCRYSTTANTTYAAMTNTFATTGATNHSTPVTGLQSGSYTFYVRCTDGTGNAGTADFAITFTVGTGDITAPTVSVTAPAGGASVSGTSVAVTATAADDVGVAGVQFLLDGAALGAEDTTSPYSVNWDTTTASNANHTLTARARDAAGNQSTSAGVTVTVGNAAQSGGLRVAYPLSAGSGTTVADVSTNNTPATATSPTWTTSGRYGNAITFNGTSSRVRSNSSINLTGTFTIEAWVLNPTNQASESIVTVGSNRDLYITNGTLRFFTGATTLTFGTVAANTWQHVAIVSDGSTVRAYVDGSQSGSTQNAALGSFSGPVQLGAWTDGTNNGDFFSGTIDEVRVYTRALTATEIATDRTTPL